MGKQIFYYQFLSEEESDFEGGLFLICTKEQFDADEFGLGLIEENYTEFIKILESVEIQQESENNFTNYPDYTETQFLALFENTDFTLIKKDLA